MTAPRRSPRQRYNEWVEDSIEDYKSSLTRDELLSLADQAIDELFHTDDGQYPLTEILLRDAVDRLIAQRLALPGFRRWQRMCQSDTPPRPCERTVPPPEGGRQAS